MSDSSKRVKPASIAAFVFMPQIGQMFHGASHIIPIFVRTIAHLYVQAGLLPPTHPAANYGAPGVEKCGFLRMMGDAWFTIRTTAATAYQWSVFCTVLMMTFVLISTIIMTLFNMSTFFVGSASAQIFTALNGPTDIQNMPAPAAPCTAATPFCRVIPPLGNSYGDYAIDILDKMLRLGANQTGGPLQNATGGLMQVYNAGVLVVAGCLLFWLIISVVVDIARTGQVGGGRHNLVWAPIRIVFALGMLIPLGTSGFSSGQFVVMKLAEWGSNFGTNGWNAYLAKIEQNVNVVPSLPLGQDVMPLVEGYERMWICRVAHNGYGYQAEGVAFTQPTPAQEVYLRPVTSEIDKGSMKYTYSNLTTQDLCGSVTFPTGNEPGLQGLINPPAGTVVNPVALASAQFQVNMDLAWQKLFVADYAMGQANQMIDVPNLPLGILGLRFACGFVAQHIWGQVAGAAGGLTDVLSLDCNSYGAYLAPQCGSGAGGSGKYPDLSCVDNPSAEGDTGTMAGLIRSTILQAANTNIATLKNLPLSALFGQRGWADMGSFYKAISTLAKTVNGALSVPVAISAPGLQDGNDNQSAKVEEVMSKFDDWWATVPEGEAAPTPPSNNCNANPPPAGCPAFQHHGGWGSIVSFFGHVGKDAVGDVNGAIGIGRGIVHGIEDVGHFFGHLGQAFKDPTGTILKEVDKFTRDYEGTSFLGIPNANDPAHVNDYPLAIVSEAGVILFKIALGFYTVITAGEIAASFIPTVDIGATFATSVLGNLLDIVGDSLMSCVAILLFYLPLLPFIRVAFAVLTWMVTVFEAVMLLPVACLSFLDTEKEGMYAKHPFINWLDVLLRPILTVIGYVGAVLVFDTFFAYFQDSFSNAIQAEVSGTNVFEHLVAMFVNVVLFVFLMYSAANTSFKLLTVIPNAFFRWLPGAQPSAFHDEGPDAAGVVGKLGGMANKGLMKASGAEGRVKEGWTGSAKNIKEDAVQAAQIAGASGSDRRLKENIEPMGTENGFNVYKFNYIGNSQKYIGVMADEVLKVNPDAVCEKDGYLAVYYNKIGVEFRTVD